MTRHQFVRHTFALVRMTDRNWLDLIVTKRLTSRLRNDLLRVEWFANRQSLLTRFLSVDLTTKHANAFTLQSMYLWQMTLTTETGCHIAVHTHVRPWSFVWDLCRHEIRGWIDGHYHRKNSVSQVAVCVNVAEMRCGRRACHARSDVEEHHRISSSHSARIPPTLLRSHGASSHFRNLHIHTHTCTLRQLSCVVSMSVADRIMKRMICALRQMWRNSIHIS